MKCTYIAVASLTLAASAGFLPASSVRAQAVEQNEYRINPGDELEVFVWGEERLQRQVRVLPDGTFSYPLAGKVIAEGRTTSEIETSISRGLEAQYRGAVPQVTVSVRAPAGLQFSIIGKVRNPGTFTPGRYINLLEALSIAGGPSEFAQLGSILVVRKEGSALRSFKVRLGPVLRGTPSETDLSESSIPQIKSGDTIVVP